MALPTWFSPWLVTYTSMMDPGINSADVLHRKPLSLTFSVVAPSPNFLLFLSTPRSFSGTRNRSRTSVRDSYRNELAVLLRQSRRALKFFCFLELAAAPPFLLFSFFLLPPFAPSLVTPNIFRRP